MMYRRITRASSTLSFITAILAMAACTDDGGDDETGQTETSETSGGDSTTGMDTEGETTTADTEGDTTTGIDTVGDTTTGMDTETDTGGGAFCDNDPGFAGGAVVGQPAPHITGFDHTGAEFNLCTYGGTPIVIDVAAMWCGPCQAVSAYFASGGADPFGGGIGVELSTMINGGTAAWITMLVEDVNSAPATVENAASWDAMYHNANIPVVVQGDVGSLPGYFNLACWPSAFIVDHEMNWMGLDDCQTWNQLAALIAAY